MDNDTMSSHSISITERKNISISGVKKIDSFDNVEFLMDTVMGYLTIKGSDLEIVKLDTFQGNMSIKGKIDSLTYSDTGGKKKEDGVFSKLFK